MSVEKAMSSASPQQPNKFAVVSATLRGKANATLTVDVEVDATEVHLCVPEWVAQQLQLTEHDRRVRRGLSVPYVGPILLTVGKRTICCGAVVTGDSVRLGGVPLGDLESAGPDFLFASRTDPRWTQAGWLYATQLDPLELAALGRWLLTAIPIFNVIAGRNLAAGRHVSAWIESGLLLHANIVEQHYELVEMTMRRVEREVLTAVGLEQREAALASIWDELAAMREALDQRQTAPVGALKGLVRPPSQPVTLDAMDGAVRDAYAAERLRYAVKAEEDGVWVARWLDGELASDGATEAEAIANLREAVELYRKR